MPPLAGVAAKFVAPMVANIASGLIQNVAGQALKNLPLIGDSFQKIAGGIGQIFSGGQQVMGGIGQLAQLLAPRGLFPPLPLPGLPGFPGGRPFNPRLWFGPRHVHVHVDINKLFDQLQKVLQPGSQLLNNLNQVLGKLGGILDSLRGILDRLGQQPPRFGIQPPPSRLYYPPGPPLAGPGVGGTLDKLFGEMGNIQDQIGKIDTSKPEGMAQLMKLQMRMQQIQQMIQMINEMHKAMHDMSMSIIRNIR